MMEYEINPAAGGSCIYWPDVSKFSDAHTERFTLHQPRRLVEHALFGLLTDFPHEIVHLLQGTLGQVQPDTDTPAPRVDWLLVL